MGALITTTIQARMCMKYWLNMTWTFLRIHMVGMESSVIKPLGKDIHENEVKCCNRRPEHDQDFINFHHHHHRSYIVHYPQCLYVFLTMYIVCLTVLEIL